MEHTDYSIDENAACDELKHLFDEAVKLRMISDVPIGAFLSGGVDSSAVASELKKSIKDYIGISTTIEVCEPGEVARSEGKAVRVVDERDTQ